MTSEKRQSERIHNDTRTNTAWQKHGNCGRKEPSFAGLETKVLSALPTLIKKKKIGFRGTPQIIEEQLLPFNKHQLRVKPSVQFTFFKLLITFEVDIVLHYKDEESEVQDIKRQDFLSLHVVFNCNAAGPSRVHPGHTILHHFWTLPCFLLDCELLRHKSLSLLFFYPRHKAMVPSPKVLNE